MEIQDCSDQEFGSRRSSDFFAEQPEARCAIADKISSVEWSRSIFVPRQCQPKEAGSGAATGAPRIQSGVDAFGCAQQSGAAPGRPGLRTARRATCARKKSRRGGTLGRVENFA